MPFLFQLFAVLVAARYFFLLVVVVVVKNQKELQWWAALVNLRQLGSYFPPSFSYTFRVFVLKNHTQTDRRAADINRPKRKIGYASNIKSVVKTGRWWKEEYVGGDAGLVSLRSSLEINARGPPWCGPAGCRQIVTATFCVDWDFHLVLLIFSLSALDCLPGWLAGWPASSCTPSMPSYCCRDFSDDDGVEWESWSCVCGRWRGALGSLAPPIAPCVLHTKDS